MADERLLRVEGLADLQRAFRVADRRIANDFRKELREAAEPVRAAAEQLAVQEITRVGPNWSRMRVGVTRTSVYVAPRERGARRGAATGLWRSVRPLVVLGAVPTRQLDAQRGAQCTTGRLVDTPGPIKGLRRLGSNIVAYKDTSMYLGQYVEPPLVWDWQVISSNVGCSSHDAVVNIGKAHVFLGADNAYMYDGASVMPIGEPIREWFFDSELNRAYVTRIQSCHDPAKSLVYWFYPPSTSNGPLTRCLVYNYKLNRWGLATYAVEAAVDYVAAGVTYDGIGSIYSTYDAGIDRTYDSPLWVPERIVPAVINSAHVMHTIDLSIRSFQS